MKLPEVFDILIVTLSDRASAGVYEDLSGRAIKERIVEFFDSLGWRCKIDNLIIPDDAGMLGDVMVRAAAERNLIFTTGGTGIGPRDITVDVIKPLLERELPGIMEYIRVRYGAENPNALLSRAVAGVAGEALIYTLPGSVKAVGEYLTEILKTLKHTVLMQYGIDAHHTH
ncbi:MAG: MogA/MoaB family molybdenum cofactor biosynthesis protein [Bacteroidales bacterium]|jgi:molybdenum cofactor synthesis domain-containing protein|nr:MogA/MoaB family molybdenum cofactor biosynthesis protein [Bacteroidales bacterium]